MTVSQAARRYGTALARIAEEDRAWEALRTELRMLREAWGKNADLRATLLAPEIERNQRIAVALKVAAALGLSPVLRSFVRVLMIHRRIGLLPEVLEDFEERADAAEGRIRGAIVTARPWTEQALRRIAEAWSQALGLTVALTERVDPEILGGAIVRVGNRVWEGSVQGALDRLGRRLLG